MSSMRAHAKTDHHEVVEDVDAGAHLGHARRTIRRRPPSASIPRSPPGRRCPPRAAPCALATTASRSRTATSRMPSTVAWLYESPACVITPRRPSPQDLARSRAARGHPVPRPRDGRRCRSPPAPECARPPWSPHRRAPCAPSRLSTIAVTCAPRPASAARRAHLAGHDAHGVEDVVEAVVEEILRLAQRRYRDRTRGRTERAARDLDAFSRSSRAGAARRRGFPSCGACEGSSPRACRHREAARVFRVFPAWGLYRCAATCSRNCAR